jgi:hypothetical protein
MNANERPSDAAPATASEPTGAAVRRRYPRLVRLLVFGVIVGSLGIATGEERVNTPTEHVLGVPGMSGEVTLTKVAELRGLGSKFRMLEITGDTLNPAVEPVDVCHVGGPNGIGGLLGAATLGSPTTEELTETAASGHAVSTVGSEVIDDRPRSATADKGYDYWKCLAVHAVFGAMGGICGAFLMMLLRGDLSNERPSGGSEQSPSDQQNQPVSSLPPTSCSGFLSDDPWERLRASRENMNAMRESMPEDRIASPDEFKLMAASLQGVIDALSDLPPSSPC